MKYFLHILIALLLIKCSGSIRNKSVVGINDTAIEANKAYSTTKKSEESEITCPKCGHKKKEELPTEVCLVSYTCENCKEVMHPKDGDCCVFCTYGTHKCPSKQEL